MPSGGVIVLARVRPGKEEELFLFLNRLGNDINGRELATSHRAPRIEFRNSHTIHFARLALMDDPDSGAGRKRLLVTTDFDGPLEAHVRELLALTTDSLAIWGCCEDYGGGADFAAFLDRNRIEPATYYLAFRGDNLPRIRDARELREVFCALLAAPGNEALRAELSGRLRLLGWIRRAWRRVAAPVLFIMHMFAGLKEIPRLRRQFGWAHLLLAGRQITATLGRIPWIRLINSILGNGAQPPTARFSQASPWTPARLMTREHPPEDTILQNQLTLVTDVRAEELPRQKAVLAIINHYARRLATPGNLVGISTIHTVRWALIDGGRRLLMVSNYDGSWENYIDEFAEMILSGLNALWSSAPDFPQAGAADVPAFKQFLRTHQVPANVFYSAYPQTSVLNLKQDLEFQTWNGWLLRGLPTPATRLPAASVA